MGLVNEGRGQISTPTAPRPLNRFSLNLKYMTTTRKRPRMRNFRGLCRRGWSGQIASLTHESFCPFFPFFITPTGCIFGHIPTHNTSLYVNTSFPPRKCLLGVRKMKFDPIYPQKRKNGTLSWRSMANCSRPNSGTVSRIQFKLQLATGIDRPLAGITWHDSKVKRSRS